MRTRVSLLFVASLVFSCLIFASIAEASRTSLDGRDMVRIPGHVLPVLAKAKKIAPSEDESKQTMTLTIVFKRDDQAGFTRPVVERLAAAC